MILDLDRTLHNIEYDAVAIGGAIVFVATIVNAVWREVARIFKSALVRRDRFRSRSI